MLIPKVKFPKITVPPRVIAVIAIVCIFAGYACYMSWRDHQAVFQDVTVELGTESLSIRDFMTDMAIASRASFVTDPAQVDLSRVGQTPLALKHGAQFYTVMLTVQDTTAPTAKIEPYYEISVADAMPEAKDLVQDVQDASSVKVYYAQEPTIPDDYSACSVTIVVEDAYGNKLEQDCQFQYYGWLKDNVTLELGETLTPELLLSNPQKDGALLDQAQLVKISRSVGEHTISITLGDTQASCTVLVQDTTGPELTLQTVRCSPWDEPELDDFIVSVSDASGDPQVRMVSDAPDYSVKGTYPIVIEAQDIYGNVTTEETTLFISTDTRPPVIQGAAKDLSMEKYSSPDFLEGVTAKDNVDGSCQVTVDTSSLDPSTAGTYYITYSAVDSSGNASTYKRKVVVEPNEEDTAALAREIADSLSDDPEQIRDYVRETIAYSHNWGGDNPVWFGFTMNHGNCYVHALCLQTLLELKGYETQLIWVTNKTHYWLIIKLDEGWRHIDATPGTQHSKISLMTDEERATTLSGRDWDRSQWPACE